MSARVWSFGFVLAGCTSFGEATTTNADGGPPVDAAAERTNSDPDGSVHFDGSAPFDAGALPCPVGALFCDAFDPRANVQGAWGAMTTAMSATLVIDSTLFRSAPGSLRATTPSGQGGDAHLEKIIQPVPTTVHVRFAVQFTSLQGVGYARVFAGHVDGRDFEIAVGATNFQLHTVDTNAALNYETVNKAPTAGTWQQVDYTLVLTPTGSVSFSLDGTPVYAKSLSLGSTNGPTTLQIRLGATSQGAFDVRYDDFSVAPD
jgi:hypothetical protein